jgi:hypothetical protein
MFLSKGRWVDGARVRIFLAFEVLQFDLIFVFSQPDLKLIKQKTLAG